MKNTHKYVLSFLIAFFFINNVVLSQNNIPPYKFNKQRALQILKDSIWFKYDLWKKAGRGPELTKVLHLTEETAREVEFLIVPEASFIKNDTSIFSFEKPLTNFLRINKTRFYAFMRYKNYHLGFITVFKNEETDRWDYWVRDRYRYDSGYDTVYHKICRDVGGKPDIIFFFPEVYSFFYYKGDQLKICSINYNYRIWYAKIYIKLISTRKHIQKHIRGAERYWWQPEMARENLP